MNLQAQGHIPAPLDPGFQPAAIASREYEAGLRGPGASLVIGLEREGGLTSRHEMRVRPEPDEATLRHVERTLKFLLWSRGGFRLYLGGPAAVCSRVEVSRSEPPQVSRSEPPQVSRSEPPQVRPFDREMMSRIYEHPFETVVCAPGDVPEENEAGVALGGHMDGCRIGFDLGASDFKVAAVREGEVVYSAEFPWNPREHADPAYHYERINTGLREAAAHLPGVDAIGGSSAGVIVGNRVMVASLFRSVPEERYGEVRDIFLRLRREWDVPFEVANDGDVTALAGALSLGSDGILGIAMGSSEAAGYIDAAGRMKGWLNELAFAPVDYSPRAAVDEWSGDRGVGVQYFSQQAVGRLLPLAGIDLPAELPLPERLVEVQALMAGGDPRARAIYETVGVYLGYGVAHYSAFYNFERVLVLGRVTTGEGGEVCVRKARDVLSAELPELAERITLSLPDEKSRRVGQAVAAASLPHLMRNA